jgi:O-antigen ligase
MGLILVVMTVVLHPRFENFDIKHITDRATYQTEQIEPRINIWHVAMQNPQDYIWYGLGAGGDKEYLASLYDSQNWDHFYERKYNTHNQYLGILVGLGIFAAIFFLLIWFLYPLWYSNKAKHIATLFAIIIGSNMLTENMLDRIDGVIITCVSMLAIVLFSRAQLSK